MLPFYFSGEVVVVLAGVGFGFKSSVKRPAISCGEHCAILYSTCNVMGRAASILQFFTLYKRPQINLLSHQCLRNRSGCLSDLIGNQYRRTGPKPFLHLGALLGGVPTRLWPRRGCCPRPGTRGRYSTKKIHSTSTSKSKSTLSGEVRSPWGLIF